MVTEASGDINIGKYEFRLTVKDAEMLTSSATLTFNVKKGSSSVSCRDETIRSSHDTIRIDTKGDDMVIFDTIRRIIIVKIQTFTITNVKVVSRYIVLGHDTYREPPYRYCIDISPYHLIPSVQFYCESILFHGHTILWLNDNGLVSGHLNLWIFSSPEHEVLMVSYCGQWLSVVRRRASSVVRRALSVVRQHLMFTL